MGQNLSYENELRLNENGKLFALTFVLKRWEWFNMGYREYRYHSTLCMYSLNSGGKILSLSLQVPVMPIKLFWRMHNA